MSKTKLIALGFHGLMQMGGAGALFIGFRSEATEILCGYLFVTGLVMGVLAYNRLIVNVYLKDASVALRTAKKAKKHGVMDSHKLKLEQA